MRPAPDELVLVALSGGVDSAVAAALLLRQGLRVAGLHMTNWADDSPYCTAARDLGDARRICHDLGIVLHELNFADTYRAEVFAPFLDALRAGRTPNPDIACNRHIKFGQLRALGQRLGGRWLATGHYARLTDEPRPRLLAAVDGSKDQSYFLHRLDQAALGNVLFPLGERHKAEVRELARSLGLHVHAKHDSTGLCFVGERPFADFIRTHLPDRPGPILTEHGEHLGEHRGLHLHTPGQRQGLGIGGRTTGSGNAWYVARKDLARNALIVVQGHDHPSLYRQRVPVRDLHWIHADPSNEPAGQPLRARLRHRQPLAGCVLQNRRGDRADVVFEEAQRAPAPGQALVLYQLEECLGGGLIDDLDDATTPAHPL
jgi:tRNA-specific 2-thiouridylase